MSQVKLPRAPLIFAVAQVRFSPIEKMRAYVEDIQECLRNEGFPRFEEGEMVRFNFLATPEGERKPKWTFSDQSRSMAVILATDFVLFETCRYETFETFSNRFLDISQWVQRNAKPSLMTRLGLRYINLLRPINGISPEELLQPGLRGISMSFAQGRPCFRQSHQDTLTEAGHLRISLWESDDDRVLPPDLTEDDLDFDVELKEDERKIILDIDHFTEEMNEEFSIEAARQILHELHNDGTEPAFREIVTEEAIQAWEKEG